MNFSRSESKLIKADKLPPRRKQMPSVFWVTLKGVTKVLFKELGVFRGLWVLLRVAFWDIVFNRPEWHAEYFEFKDAGEERHFKKVFDEIIVLLLIFNYLKEKYGEDRADEITSRMAIPTALPYLLKTFHHIENLTDIDQLRQLFADYIGEDSGFEWTEEVSEDKKKYVTILQNVRM